MHELAVATGIVEIALSVLKEHHKQKLISVRIVIGALTCVDERALMYALDPATKGTAMENAEVIIERSEAIAKCRKCHQQFAVESFIVSCPSCQSMETDMVQGRELYVKSIEAE